MSYDTEYQIETAIEWIESLAAKEYPQDTKRSGNLQTKKSTFCCLGVLNYQEKIVNAVEEDTWGDRFAYISDGIDPAPTYVEEAGLKRRGQTELAIMNDGGNSFPEIARELICNPETYFEKDVAEGIKEYFWR